MKEKKTVFVTDGKDSETVNDFVDELKDRKGNAEQIKQVSCDIYADI